MRIDIQKPEWLDEAMADAYNTLRLMKAGHVPEVLHGQFIVGISMRLLRCVYGSDLNTAVAIRKRALADVEMWQKIDAMTDEELKAYFKEQERSA